jgi:hypothetical protein
MSAAAGPFFLIQIEMPFSRDQKKGIRCWSMEKRNKSEKADLFFFFEVVFGCAANGTCPIPGHIFPFGTWVHAIVGIARFRVVNIAAECAYIPVH